MMPYYNRKVTKTPCYQTSKHTYEVHYLSPKNKKVHSWGTSPVPYSEIMTKVELVFNSDKNVGQEVKPLLHCLVCVNFSECLLTTRHKSMDSCHHNNINTCPLMYVHIHTNTYIGPHLNTYLYTDAQAQKDNTNTCTHIYAHAHRDNTNTMHTYIMCTQRHIYTQC